MYMDKCSFLSPKKKKTT